MSRPLILFFSRGRGYGHAVTDLEIEKELAGVKTEFAVLYCSYGTGIKVFRSRGKQVCDLHLADDSSPLTVLLKASVEIKKHKPRLIISHEELFVPIAAKIYGIPCIYISTWLPPPASVGWEAVQNADSILVIEDEGIFPPPAAANIRYSGPVVRKMRYSLRDRARLREELGYGPDAVGWTVIPGGWATEGRAPIAHTVLAAFRKLRENQSDTHLLWLGDVTEPAIAGEFKNTPNVRILPFFDEIEKYMVVSDVIFTKGTHGVTLEAAQLGVPSISLSHKSNPVDEILVPRIGNNTHLHALAITPEILFREAERLRMRRSEFPLRDYSEGSSKAARILYDEIVRLTKSRNAKRVQSHRTSKTVIKNFKGHAGVSRRVAASK